MARKGCFEVVKLKITFYCSIDESGKTKLVSEGLEKYLKKYDSNTSYKISHLLCDIDTTDVVVIVEFSRSISVNTVNNILSHLIGEKMRTLTYMPPTKEMLVSVLG